MSRIKEALACLVIGTIVATAVYGITVLQTYIYFGNSRRDSIRLKLFVALLFALDTISLVLTVAIMYGYVVSDFGNPLLLLKANRSIVWENGITVIIATFTQCYFAHRIWDLSKGNMVLTSSVIILALCSCGPGIAISVDLYIHPDSLFVSTIETRVLSGFANGLSVVCDVLIAVTLSYYLRSKRTGFKRTDSIINRLIIYAVNRGALTAMCQAGHMIAIVALPGRFIFFPFAVLDGRMYCNTLMATLNAQRSILQEDRNHTGGMGTVNIQHTTTIQPTAVNLHDSISPPPTVGNDKPREPSERTATECHPCVVLIWSRRSDICAPVEKHVHLLLGAPDDRILAGFANALSVICDLFIATAMCMYLSSKRAGFRQTDSIIDRLMIYAINRGLLTATCQACHMISCTIAFPGCLIYFPFSLLDGKLYCTTLLATLNAQRDMRGDGTHIIEVGSNMLDHIHTSTSRHGTHLTTPGRLSNASAH
ncbi:hypothetical protein GSI_02808 [Ganoderma sinense ZZ0214-1]|uniref:DUF6534 domain-containing protein n=1 Tax=Ganoderma sinense ZZ0214-1 TaxID=1077348 RepID=A0A2G8SMN6_9APHY|nr:hypothetical protein GSI_02808 [Ganoderma sinense ZZ0214-1]